MNRFVVGDRRYLSFPKLSALRGVVHGFSTKPHDIALRNGPDVGQRAYHRGQFARDLGLDPVRVTPALQVHKTGIAIIDSPLARVPDVDALVTRKPSIPLMTFSADCPLLLIVAPEARVLAMAHTSWRCTVAALTMLVIRQMQASFGISSKDLHVGIGPSAGPDQYEVGEEVREAAREIPESDAAFRERDGRLYFDLWQANRAQLIAAGVPAEQIELAGLCTMTERELLYSHRMGEKGRFALMAALTE